MSGRRFRVHLSSLMVFVLVFSVMGYVCFFWYAQPVGVPNPDLIRRNTEVYGWPMTLVLRGEGTIYLPTNQRAEKYSYHNYRAGKSSFAQSVSPYFFGCLAVNLAVALIPSWWIARFVERRARRKDVVPEHEPEEAREEEERS